MFFVLLVCLSLVAISAWNAWNARKVQLRELKTATENTAHALAQHADDAFKAVDTSLLGLSERIEYDGASAKALDRLHKLLVMRVSELPELKGLFIYDKEGRWLVTSRPSFNPANNNADREYFIYHRDHPDPGPYVGVPVRSRSTGEWVIPLSRRLNDANGHFAGVVRLNSYRHLVHFPLIVSAALSKNEVLAEWRQATILNAAVNRRQFDIVLKDGLSRAARSASSLALIMIDVDCFKQYNDLYGHLAGDQCLQQVGKALQTNEGRVGDLAARYGGEEFALLLPNTDVAGALQVAEEIRKTVRALDIRHERNLPGMVTISAGVNALTPVTGSDTPSVLIGAADQALYFAKTSGRDRVQASS